MLNQLVEALGPWPTVSLLLGALGIPFLFVIALFARSIKVGPVAIEKLVNAAKATEKSAQHLDRLAIVMAESRIVELKIALRAPYIPMNSQERAELEHQVNELSALVSKTRA